MLRNPLRKIGKRKTKTMGKCIVIKTDNTVTIEDMPTGVDLCHFINDIVRWKGYDYFERVQFYSAKCQLWCNEAALCLNPQPPINRITTIICNNDIMYGGMCITGLDNEKDGTVLPINKNIEEFGIRLINLINEDPKLEHPTTTDLIRLLVKNYKFKMFA